MIDKLSGGHARFRWFSISILIVVLVCAPLTFPTLELQTLQAQTSPNELIRVNSQGSSCGFYDWVADTTKCLWIPFMSWLGSWVLTLGGSVLLLAGMLFDTFLQYLVIDFGETIQSLRILNGIQQGWQLFTDISNIAIIGVFVFVAVMTILGSGEYGAKRLIARVLIVAVLINFSLLFTRMIVEGTNFVSGQFARAMPGQNENGDIATARSFLTAFGIEGVWSETSRITERVGQQAESGWAGFFYGLVGGIVLLVIALVLLYGVFVISARALLLIFAMLTASLAFVSFLLPKMAHQPYIGWSSWWSNLIKAALFGPLLMVFLWITMAFIGQAANTAGAGAAIGAIADDPSQATPDAWAAIILLVIGTGMLFVAIRAAGSFASSVGGFNWAVMAPQFFARTGIAGSAMLGRQFGGGLAARALQTQRVAGMKGARGRILRNTLAGAATASWDGRNLPGVAKATKELGLNLGKVMNKGGYVQGLKDREDKVKKAEAIRSELIGRETGVEKRKQQDAKGAVGKADEQNKDLKGLQTQAADVQKTALQSAEKELSQMQTKLKEERERMFGVMGDPSAASAKRNDIDKLEEAIRTQTDKIERVKQGNDEEVKKKLGDLPSRIEKLTKSIEEQSDATEEASTYLKQMKEGKIGPKARQEAHVRTVETNRYFTLLGNKPKSREIADKIRGDFRKSKDQKEKDKLVKLLANLEKDASKPEVKTEEKKDDH